MRSYIKGARFGNLVAMEQTDQRINGAVVWRCVCDCGSEVLVESRKLTSGRVTDCGCKVKRYPKDISGMKFGKLTAVRKTDKRSSNNYVIWKCVCDCGNEIEVSRNNLVQGITSSCGCAKKKSGEDVRGRTFGEVKVLDYNGEKRGMPVWKCRCSCGRYIDAFASELLSGKVSSCGCKEKDAHADFSYNNKYDLSGKLSKSNHSGYKGVSYRKKDDRWVARIMVDRKDHYLGSYPTLEQAVRARAEAEKRFGKS